MIVIDQEVNARIAMLAAGDQMASRKFAQEMDKQGRLPEIYQSLVHEKVFAFLQEHARIEDVAPTAPANG